MVAPGGDEEFCSACCSANSDVVAFAYGFVSFVELAWVGRAQREDVDDIERSKTPVFGEVDAAGDCGVVLYCVSSGWVEHAKTAARQGFARLAAPARAASPRNL